MALPIGAVGIACTEGLKGTSCLNTVLFVQEVLHIGVVVIAPSVIKQAQDTN